MKVATIGTGYVGLVTGAMFAHRGNQVTCVDQNPQVVEKLANGHVHIFEPGLEEIVAESVSRGSLSFTTDLASGVKDADVIFLAVGTPSDDDGSFNLRYVRQAAADVAKAIRHEKGFKVIVGKSTVPQGTYKDMVDVFEQNLNGNKDLEVAYVSNPETLAEGSAVSDFSKPDRILIGTDSDKAYKVMEELYHPFVINTNNILRGSPSDAELAKLFANTALATRIAMVNEFARVADVTPHADMDVIRRMVCEDKRIGYKFMFPSPGYGGSCFPKDVQGLVARAKTHGYEPLLLSQVHPSNEAHKYYLGDRVASLLEQASPTVGVWGLTFKPNTDDMRDAASIPILTRLINEGVKIKAYDPQDEKAKAIFGDKIEFATSQYDAAKDVDALMLLTEWKQFDAPNYARLKEVMKGNQLFDLRNRWLPQAANKQGFDYVGVGRYYPVKK